jgi:hypothetical protein
MKKLLIIPFIILLLLPIIYSADCINARTGISISGELATSPSFDIGDLDGDGDNDIVVADTGNNALVWYNQTSNGVFSNITAINDTLISAAKAIIVDLDEDGDNDIISVGSSKVLYSNNIDGKGNFDDLTVASGSSFLSIDVGDLDGDGDLDFVLPDSNSHLEVYFNDGSETFTLQEDLLTLAYAKEPEIVDLDLDGDNDIVVGCQNVAGDECLRWFENNGVGGFTHRDITDEIAIFDTESGDIDGDGDIDIVTASDSATGQIALVWMENNGYETFTQNNISQNVAQTTSLHLSDLDNDGDLDIVAADESLDRVTMWENDGTGNFIGANLTDRGDFVNVGEITGDDIDDIIYFDSSPDLLYYIDGFGCEHYPTGAYQTECNFPSLFCDDFNYVSAMSGQGWLVQLGAGQINDSFTPVDNRLQLTTSQFISPYHETEAFETSYRPDSGSRFTKHIHSPIFSSQFYLNITNQTDGGFKYAAYQIQNIPAYIIKGEVDTVGNSSGNVNWFYVNETQPSVVWKNLCSNCTLTRDNVFIKINSLFTHREEFPFNSSISDDEILVYADNVLIGTIENYIDSRTLYISQYEFIKEDDYEFFVDDYYVMVGTDITTPTFEQYYEDYFIDTDVINETIDYGQEGTGDMAEALATIWDDMGLLSIASRIMTGLFLMFLLALIMFGMALKTDHPLSPAVLIVVEMFFMVLLVYIKLLPIWLPFVIVLIAAGIGAAVIKLGTQT